MPGRSGCLEHPLAPLALGPPPSDQPPPKPLAPFEDPDLSWGRGLGLTFKALLLSPRDFFGRFRPGPGLAGPLMFGLTAASTGLMISFCLGAAGWLGDPYASGRLIRLAAATAGLILTPLAVLGLILVQALWLQVWLIAFRAASAGLAGTMRAVSYAAASLVVLPLPVVGSLLALVWGLVILLSGLTRLHRAGLGRVAAALVVPPLALAAASLLLVRLGLELLG